nr:MbeB family mobilization protein [Escherichia coli]
MSNLLRTGAEFEKKLKERAESTEKMLNDEFSRLGESVSEAVTSNETKIKGAIAQFTASTEESLKKHREGVKEAMMQHRKDMLKLAGSSGMRLLGIVFLLFTASGGTLWYLGGRIQTNLEEIRVQEETLRKLNAKTWGVEFVQDGRRKFLVLPYGKSAEVTHYQGKDWIQLIPGTGASAGNTGTHAGWSFAGMVKP